MNLDEEKKLGWANLIDFKREDIRALHKTWFAFFLTFYVWFNMAPLATTIVKTAGLTLQQIKLLAIVNVALTIPGRVIIGMISDRIGPRRTFTLIMVSMSIPCILFAFGNSYTQLLVSRLVLSLVGTGFVVGIHMTSLWFKPRDIGFAQGVEAGLGNWGSSIAAITMPVIAINVFGKIVGDAYGWRYAIALSGVVMLLYGIYYWFSITDGPAGAKVQKGRKAKAIEVSTWGDLINAILWTIPVIGILGIMVWRIEGLGFMNHNQANITYIILAGFILYQVIQILHFNIPILRKGVPEDDRYRFTDVACLNASYAITFGAELAIVSMIPAFFEKTFSLSPQLAGLIGSVFAFLNFFSRALGGYISDRMSSRKTAHLIYIVGVTVTMAMMGFINPSWPLLVAVFVTMASAVCVTGGCGTTYAIVPLIKRRITGNISGYVGGYGNVGAVIYLTAYTFVNDSQFFLLISGFAAATLLFCLFFLREPAGSFAREYRLSSVDRQLMGLEEVSK